MHVVEITIHCAHLNDNKQLTLFHYFYPQRGMCLRCKGRKGLRRGRNRCRRMGYWATPLFGRKNQAQYYLTTTGHAPFTGT